MYFLSAGWFASLIRSFFFGIDKIVYSFMPILYDFLISIARTSILTQADIADMADRIYRLLAVFMVFKVTFSLVIYTVNPDDFTDKEKGAGKLVTNIVISLALLILTPYIFNYAFQLQTIVLEDNTMQSLIFGSEANNANLNVTNSPGDKMAYMTIQPFFLPNYALTALESCSQLYDVDTINSSDRLKVNKACEKALNTATGNLIAVDNYIQGINNGSFGLVFRSDILNVSIEDYVSNNKEYIIDYRYIFSTVVGVVIDLILISFCMDVAVRSVKLSFLQLIAPIPIISYVDPKSGKDGLFKKWYQMSFKTYLSLFIRLLAVYFATFIISKVDGMVDIIDGTNVSNFFIKIFIIIGSLMFAKQLPKILEGLGIKLDGDGKLFLNPIKKINEQTLGGKQLTSATGAGLAGAAAFGTNLIARKGNIFSAAAGALSATGRGLINARKGEGLTKNFSNSYNTAMKNRQSRADRKADDVGWAEMQESKIKQKLGMHTGGDNVKSATDLAKKIQTVYDSMMNAARGNDKAIFTATINGTTQTFAGIKGIDNFIKELSKTSIKRENYANENDYLQAVADHRKSIDDAEDAMKQRLNAIADGTADSDDDSINAAVRSGFSQMQKLAGDLNAAKDKVDKSIANINTKGDAKTIYGTAKGIENQIVSSKEASHQEVVDKYARNKEQK